MSRLPRITRALRFLHTEGRQIDHTGPSTSPSPHSHLSPSATSIHPSAPVPQVVDPIPTLLSSRPNFTPKGRPILRRPAREVPVTLPNGDPEPPFYPPPSEYFDGLDDRKKDPHPLWQFFHVPVKSRARLGLDTPPPQEMGSLETLGNDDQNLHSGRSWTAAELRQKSFKDLHTLWYVLLRERNVLATQREERRVLSIGSRVDGELLMKRAFRCRKTMARIKYVLNERRLGLIAAAGPHLNTEPTHIPWSASPTSDPAGATAAIRGETDVPLHVLEPSSSSPSSVREQDPKGDSFVEDEAVSEEEVESRDEGFGGGKEAEEFVNDIEVTKDGKVEKKE
ncbi:hypothetical protein CI109_104101 [Kwoniella shandongensis]|uniref:Large ribosomal subunit protein uL29m n=1 Tax=Kwoniella shandongensis TaxID=1734106 RepID=A0A5M6C118_9TREE|nr:uncharacterized protein CI109_002988 [Kwoniella shandongensis]KAA5528827.1 hypothetical protein CI109_002988 [Kwoniella shandongensis]